MPSCPQLWRSDCETDVVEIRRDDGTSDFVRTLSRPEPWYPYIFAAPEEASAKNSINNCKFRPAFRHEDVTFVWPYCPGERLIR